MTHRLRTAALDLVQQTRWLKLDFLQRLYSLECSVESNEEMLLRVSTREVERAHSPQSFKFVVWRLTSLQLSVLRRCHFKYI